MNTTPGRYRGRCAQWLLLLTCTGCSIWSWSPVDPGAIDFDVASFSALLLMEDYRDRPQRDVLGSHLSTWSGEEHIWVDTPPESDPGSHAVDHFLSDLFGFRQDTVETRGREGGQFRRDQAELTLESLAVEAFRVNSSIEAAEQRWHAISQRYPQVTSLQNPFFRFLAGPQLTVNRGNLDSYLHRYEVRQTIPWFGKRKLRGDEVISEAQAAAFDVHETQLTLMQAVKATYLDYLINHLHAEVLREERDLLDEQMRHFDEETMDESDLLEAELDRLKLARREESVRLNERISRAAINLLLDQDPDLPLPPPRPVPLVNELPPAAELRETALSSRPEAAAGLARVHAAEMRVDLERRERFPDVTLMARFDSTEPTGPAAVGTLRPQIGFQIYDVPIQVKKHRAAVNEAEAELARLKALTHARRNEIAHEVQVAYDRLEECRAALLLANRGVEAAARSAQLTAERVQLQQATPAELLSARRRTLRMKSDEIDAQREYYVRLIALERATGTALLAEIKDDELLNPHSAPVDPLKVSDETTGEAGRMRDER